MRPTFKDSRVHYSVNCASIGCPNLPLRAWRAETLDRDLDTAARAFINHPRGVRVGPDGRLRVSSIYKWFKEDFGGTDAGVLAHLRKYSGPDLLARTPGTCARLRRRLRLVAQSGWPPWVGGAPALTRMRAVTVGRSSGRVVRNRGADLFGRLPRTRRRPRGRFATIGAGRRRRASARVTASIGEPEAATDVPGTRSQLAFWPKLPITPASARSRPGAERTAAGLQGLLRQDRSVRRPVFPPSEHSSLSRRARRAMRGTRLIRSTASTDMTATKEGISCRYTNTSSSRARTSSAQQVEDLTTQLKASSKRSGGKVTKTEYWGVKSLSYRHSQEPQGALHAAQRRSAVGGAQRDRAAGASERRRAALSHHPRRRARGRPVRDDAQVRSRRSRARRPRLRLRVVVAAAAGSWRPAIAVIAATAGAIATIATAVRVT